MAIKKVSGCFRQQAPRSHGSDPEDERPRCHGLAFGNHGRFAQAGVAEHPIVHPGHEKYGESDKSQLDVEIRIGEGLGRVRGQEEQTRRDIDSEAHPHDGEEPLQRLQRNIAGDSENAQINDGVRADHQGHAYGVKQQDEIEPENRLRLTEPDADSRLFDGIKEFRYGQNFPPNRALNPELSAPAGPEDDKDWRQAHNMRLHSSWSSLIISASTGASSKGISDTLICRA